MEDVGDVLLHVDFVNGLGGDGGCEGGRGGGRGEGGG